MSEIVEQGGRWRTPRTRGGIVGIGLMLLGAWGAVIPFVGPYFDYAYTPNTTWEWTAARGYLEVLPGAAAVLAGLILIATADRATASMAGWLGVAAGAWFVIGPVVAPLWRSVYLGTPIGNATNVSLEQIGMFFGLGAAIVLLAAVAVGRFSVVGARDATYITEPAAATYTAPVAMSDDPLVADQPVPAAGRHGWGVRGRRRYIAH